MIVCSTLRFDAWRPDFASSGLSNPIWTRVWFKKMLLCNGLEGVDATTNPIQTLICEQCGISGCQQGGYVHLSRLDGLVLWSAPVLDEPEPWEIRHFRAPNVVLDHGALAIPAEQWRKLRNINPGLPHIDGLESIDIVQEHLLW